MTSKLIYLSLFLIYLLSCSKNNSSPAPTPGTNCKITAASIVSGGGVNLGKYSFRYNTDGSLAGSTFTGVYTDTVSYKYSGNLIYRSVAAGANSSVDTVTLNDAGMAVLDKAQIGKSVYTTNYIYDPTGLLQTYTQQQDTFPPVSPTYSFTNGDNTLITNGTAVDTLIYDLNKPAVMGNMDEFSQFLQFGYMYVKNKHLVTEEHHGTGFVYTYTYTPEGNISTIKIVIGNTNSETISYTYECQ